MVRGGYSPDPGIRRSVGYTVNTTRQSSSKLRRAALLLLPAGMALAVLAAGGSHFVHAGSPVGASDVNANTASFSTAPAGGGAAISAVAYSAGDPPTLNLAVYGMPPKQGSDQARIYADLSNGTSQVASFASGAAVEVTVTRDGQAWKTLTLTAPATASLAPGATVRLEGWVSVAGTGNYAVSAQLVGQGATPAFTLAGP